MNELFDLSDLRAVVIGGTGVLGGRFCVVLAEAGAHVVVVGRDAPRGHAVVEAITAAGGSAEFAAADVTRREDLVAVAELARADSVDILVNAAGINNATPFAELTDDTWDRVIDVDLTATFRACQIFAPLLAQSTRGGAIVNISSTSSSPPLSRVLAYGVAKAGVNNLTQYLAAELASDRIRVNALVPGFFPTEQNRALLDPQRIDSILAHTPLKRLGEPSDLDGALLWLASSRASAFVTGTLVRVDGGFHAVTI